MTAFFPLISTWRMKVTKGHRLVYTFPFVRLWEAMATLSPLIIESINKTQLVMEDEAGVLWIRPVSSTASQMWQRLVSNETNKKITKMNQLSEGNVINIMEKRRGVVNAPWLLVARGEAPDWYAMWSHKPLSRQGEVRGFSGGGMLVCVCVLRGGGFESLG